MRVVIAIAIALATLWTWDQSDLPIHPLAVVAFVLIIPAAGLWLEMYKYGGLKEGERERQPGELPAWAELPVVGGIATAPTIVALLMGQDMSAHWPFVAGLAGVVAFYACYAAWLTWRNRA